MRPIRTLVLSLGLATVSLAGTGHAWADDVRVEAKTHYQAGVKAYAGGDYRGAIKEFSAAQQLAPADLNNYNLALCYDKLGEGDTAIQYYRQYLDRVPGTDRRAEIEASIARLDAAVKSVTAKKQAEDAQRGAAEAAAKKQADQKAADDARRAAEQKAAEDASHDAEAKRTAPLPPPPPLPSDPKIVSPPVVGGSSGTPGTGEGVPTGDVQLDRAQHIDISRLRDQRVGGAASGIPDRNRGPGGPNGGPNGGPMPPNSGNLNAQVGAGAQAGGPSGPATPNGMPGAPADQAKPAEAPVYKKWWFWAVVGVSAIVLYEIANGGSSATTTRTGREQLPLGPIGQTAPSGLTLMRF